MLDDGQDGEDVSSDGLSFNISRRIAMLVLSRLEQEAVVIDKNITVRVERIRGRRVRLSITAPQQVKVMREEIAGKEEPKREDQKR